MKRYELLKELFKTFFELWLLIKLWLAEWEECHRSVTHDFEVSVFSSSQVPPNTRRNTDDTTVLKKWKKTIFQCQSFSSSTTRGAGEARLVHPVAYFWVGQGEHPGVPAGAQSVDLLPALSEPQSPGQVQATPLPQPAGPGPTPLCRPTDGGQLHLGDPPPSGFGSPLAASVAASEALWPRPPSDSTGGQHHDPAWNTSHASAEQSQGPGNTAATQPQADSPIAGLHGTAPQQVARVPARESRRWLAAAKVSNQAKLEWVCGSLSIWVSLSESESTE